VLARLAQEANLAIVPFADEHWPPALDAFQRFAKGRPPAALNFGDCITYAIAKVTGEPLLCLGEDFARTGLEVVGGS